MKIKFLLLFTLFTSYVFSQRSAGTIPLPSFHDTKGELEIGADGMPSYTLPIALPPSINSVGPTINLIYSGGVLGGLAGQSWNISGMSVISRVASRIDLDGFVDGVDFDEHDRLSLDGQRLLIKTGNYWADGSTYETEVQSNTKIELKKSGTLTYFVVTAPDGSFSEYGLSNASNGLTTFYVSKFQNKNGDVINYIYEQSYNTVNIKEINFSANINSNPTALNKILFTYAFGKVEKSNVGGVNILKTQLLKKVEVFTNNVLFKKYELTHYKDVSGYDKLQKIQEFNSDGEAANPIVFEYNTKQGLLEKSSYFYYGGSGSRNLPDIISKVELTGNFSSGNAYFLSRDKIHTSSGGQVNASGNFTNVGMSENTHGLNISKRKSFSCITLNNNFGIFKEIGQFHNLVDTYEEKNKITFNVYFLSGIQPNSPFTLSYKKEIDFNSNGNCSDICTKFNYDPITGAVLTGLNQPVSLCTTNFFKKSSNKYLEGDFNGDGISEVLAMAHLEIQRYQRQQKIGIGDLPLKTGTVLRNDENTNKPINPDANCVFVYEQDLERVTNANLIDLNPNVSTAANSVGNYQLPADKLWYLRGEEKFTGDFNGDGKTDIMSVDKYRNYQIISFRQLNQAPWTEVELLGYGTFHDYVKGKQILFGDFNGDSKLDFMTPVGIAEGCDTCDTWAIYTSNPKPNIENLFDISHNQIAHYRPSNQGKFKLSTDFYNYYTFDVNKDGKTDFVRFWSNIHQPDEFDGNQNTAWSLQVYLNKTVDFNSRMTPIQSEAVNYYQFAHVYSSPNDLSDEEKDNNSLPVPFMLSNKTFNNYGNVVKNNTFFQIWRNSPAFNQRVHYFSLNNNFENGQLLTKVTESVGVNSTEIVYQENKSFGNIFNSNSYPLTQFSTSTNSVVRQLKNTSLGVIKYQNFDYKDGFFYDVHGKGFYGPTTFVKSSWFNEGETNIKYTETSKDPLKRGALKSVKTFLNTTLLNTVDYEFTEELAPNKRYALLNTKTTNYDLLTGIYSTSTNEYTPNLYLPFKNIAETGIFTFNPQTYGLLSTTLQSSKTGLTTFDTNLSTSNYYIGRPSIVTNTITAYGDTKTNTKTFTYDSNGNVTKTEVKPLNSTVTQVETIEYLTNGLVKSKTASFVGAAADVAVTDKKIEYTYDATNRFVLTTKDVTENLTSTNNQFHPIYGLVEKQTNALGLITETKYDNWGKPLEIKDFLGKKLTYSYSKSGANYITSTSTDDGSFSSKTTDLLGREIKTSAKDINGNIVNVDTDFDYLGRKLRVSEPYFAGVTPQKFTTYRYDNLDRIIELIDYTGKKVTNNYNLRTVSSNDGLITKSKTIDGNGNTIAATDLPGGTINYKYNALGALIESDYEGNKTTITYDLWNRKTELVETSSDAPFKYTYFVDGLLKTEQTPKGITTNVYDAAGKMVSTNISGLTNAEKTNITSNYVYDQTTKQLTNINVVNTFDGNSSYVYEYDPLTKQINKSTEVINGATFIKKLEFDSFGRVKNETFEAKYLDKTTTKTITSTYKNGFKWQVLDGTTVKSQIDLTNARGKVIAATLGNGMVLNNSYDEFGYLTSAKANKNNGNQLTLSYKFEPVLGNLLSKYNSLFDFTENFYYDAQDRLNKWENNDNLFLTETFSNDIGGFILTDPNMQATVSNLNAKLNVKLLSTESNVKKTLKFNAVSGEKLNLKFDYTRVVLNGNLVARVNEVDPNTNDILSTNEYPLSLSKVFDENFEVLYDSNIELEFIVYEDPTIGTTGGLTTFISDASDFNGTILTSAVFNIDNLLLKQFNIFTQTYDNKGKITENELGTYKYNNTAKPYRNTNVNLTAKGKAYYNLPENKIQNITYTAFKTPIQIEQTGVDKLSFAYNFMQQRSIMYWGSTDDIATNRPNRRIYSADGSMEITIKNANTAIPNYEFLTYIDGSAYDALLVTKTTGEPNAAQNFYYLHRDYQGTILAVSNENANFVEKRYFDAWGSPTKVQDGASNTLSKLTFFDRGYTGHEHLESVKLINMNARLYDPVLHRFLSPDKYVQDPYNTQNYNRYGYCLNNPAKYTDRTGNIIESMLIGAGIALVSYLTYSLIANQPITYQGAFKAVIVGAISAGVTSGIGDVATTIGNFYVRSSFQALAHGSFQGTLSYVQGGNFWNGFASGSISSLASSVWSGGSNFDSAGKAIKDSGYGGLVGTSGAGMIAFGTISGGVSSMLSGGNFWAGAATGAIVSTVNHYFHDTPNRKIRKQLRKEMLTLTGKCVAGQSSLNKVGNLPTIKKMAAESGKPDLRYVNSDGNSITGGIGTFSTNAEDVDPDLIKAVTDFSKGSHINVHNPAFESWALLTEVVVHEYGHAFSRYTGVFMANYKKYGNNLYKAYQYDELYAYQRQTVYGFSLFAQGFETPNGFYVPGLQIALNKLGLEKKYK